MLQENTAYIKVFGSQGCAIMYNNVTYRFDMIGNFIGVVPSICIGCVPVSIVSIATCSGYCEIGVSIGNTFKKYTSELSIPEILGSISKFDFYSRLLRRNVTVGDKTIRQVLLVCNTNSNPMLYLERLKLKEG